MKAIHKKIIHTMIIFVIIILMWFCYYQIRLETLPNPCYTTCGGCMGNNNYFGDIFTFQILPLILIITTIGGLYAIIKIWETKSFKPKILKESRRLHKTNIKRGA